MSYEYLPNCRAKSPVKLDCLYLAAPLKFGSTACFLVIYIETLSVIMSHMMGADCKMSPVSMEALKEHYVKKK